MSIRVLVLLPVWAMWAARGRAQVSLVATGSIPAGARDLSGMTGMVGGVPHDRLGSMGSAIAWTGEGWRFVMLADRGPIDGGAPYLTRLHVVELTPDFEKKSLAWRVERTVMLTDEAGAGLAGASEAFDPGDPLRSRRFDPEGVRVARDGTVYISDEYGPRVDTFGADGKRARRFGVPAAFRVVHESAIPEDELPPRNMNGRQPNRGFEGLALSPDGSTLWAILQSPLIQDGALSSKQKRVGVNIRVLTIDVSNGSMRQFVYPLENAKLGVSEMLAIDDRRMLVLERDGEMGDEARVKGVYIADFTDATDVSEVEALPSGALAGGCRGASKRLLINLLDPAFGLAGAAMPEKIEGLAFGPDLPDGRRTLVVTTDNDFKDGAPSWVWVFAFGSGELAK